MWWEWAIALAMTGAAIWWLGGRVRRFVRKAAGRPAIAGAQRVSLTIDRAKPGATDRAPSPRPGSGPV